MPAVKNKQIQFILMKKDEYHCVAFKFLPLAWMHQYSFPKCRPCPFIQILCRFYPNFILILSRFLVTHFIQILSRLYPNFWRNLDKVGKNTLSRFYPNFILFFWKNQDKIWIKGHGRAPSILQRNSVFLFFQIIMPQALVH